MSVGTSAKDSAAGYLYQAYYALLILLNAKSGAALSVEGLEDIQFSEDGEEKLLQLKHQVVAKGNLSDRDPQLWKTFSNWSTAILDSRIDPNLHILQIVTTKDAAADSVANSLSFGAKRDVDIAEKLLAEILKTEPSKENKEYFNKVKMLDSLQLRAMLESIYIQCNEPNITQCAEEITDRMRFLVSPQYAQSMQAQAIGVWIERVRKQLDNTSKEPITQFWLFSTLQDIAAGYRPDSLPNYYGHAVPSPEEEVALTERQFVHQMKEIRLSPRRVELAMLDYYRAFKARSQWVQEDLIPEVELTRYSDRLIREWEECLEALREEFKPADNEQNVALGKKLYNELIQAGDIRIREKADLPHIMRGTYHLLADEKPPRIFWHPKFIEILQKKLVGETA